MSIEVMTRVWKQSKSDGTNLLMMLALADRADEQGVCWPGMGSLAEKTRLTDRQARRIIRDLEEAGEICTFPSVGGRKKTNQYLVTVGQTEEELRTVLKERFELDKVSCEKIVKIVTALRKKSEEVETRTSTVQTRTFRVGNPDIAMSDDSLDSPSDSPSIGADAHTENGSSQLHLLPDSVEDSSKKFVTTTKPVRRTKATPSNAPPVTPPRPPKDSRSATPQIQAVREVLDRYPAKPTWDMVIATVGERTAAELKPYYAVWVGLGFSVMNLEGWLMDWSVNGIPEDVFVPEIYQDQVRRAVDIKAGPQPSTAYNF